MAMAVSVTSDLIDQEQKPRAWTSGAGDVTRYTDDGATRAIGGGRVLLIHRPVHTPCLRSSPSLGSVGYTKRYPLLSDHRFVLSSSPLIIHKRYYTFSVSGELSL